MAIIMILITMEGLRPAPRAILMSAVRVEPAEGAAFARPLLATHVRVLP